MNGDSTDSSFGVSHLSDAPITASFGLTLFAVLFLLIILRLVFADLTVGGKVGAR